MATQNQSLYSGSGNLDHDNGYDSEEEFIDDTQFEDPEGFIDEISNEGSILLVFEVHKCADLKTSYLPFFLFYLQRGSYSRGDSGA